MTKTQTTQSVEVGQTFRSKIGDPSVILTVTRVANGKVSYRTDNGGRQRTFALANFLEGVERR